MSTQRYSVTPHPIETLLTWVKSGESAIPEIQRPFVWEAIKVRNLLDSLYQGYPVGYLIVWRNPTIKLKDGTALNSTPRGLRAARSFSSTSGKAGRGTWNSEALAKTPWKRPAGRLRLRKS